MHARRHPQDVKIGRSRIWGLYPHRDKVRSGPIWRMIRRRKQGSNRPFGWYPKATGARKTSLRALKPQTASTPRRFIRYGVVGLGHIAQTAVLPAFAHATKNSKLVAIFSQDAVKRKEVARKYHVPIAASYKEYDAVLRAGELDAVFIAEPNSLHADFTIRAAAAGVH